MILQLTNLPQSSNLRCADYKIAFQAPPFTHPVQRVQYIAHQHHIPQTHVSADNRELVYCQIKGRIHYIFAREVTQSY